MRGRPLLGHRRCAACAVQSPLAQAGKRAARRIWDAPRGLPPPLPPQAAAATETATRSVITLKGSVEIVTEFFGFAINSILFQRGIYPPETFDKVAKYGLPMLVSTDEGLKSYLSHVLTQISGWLLEGKVQKLVVVITGADSGETLERWVFNISPDKAAVTGG